METTEAPCEGMKMPEPTKEHRWLQKLVGEWTTDCEGITGTESVSPVGDVWVMGHGTGEMPGGGEAKSVMTLGFDPRTKRFVGSWVGSMMANIWVYDGWLDESEKVLTLESEGPSFDGDGTSTYRDIIELVSDDHRTLSGNVLKPDGTWHRFMTTHYHRKS